MAPPVAKRALKKITRCARLAYDKMPEMCPLLGEQSLSSSASETWCKCPSTPSSDSTSEECLLRKKVSSVCGLSSLFVSDGQANYLYESLYIPRSLSWVIVTHLAKKTNFFRNL